MGKIRILHVTQAVGGGVDRFLRMLLKYLDSDRYENILVCSAEYPEDEFDGLADKVEQLEMHREIGANDIRLALKIRKLIRRYHPDIVFAHSSKAGAFTRIADIGIRNICLYNPHGWAFNMNGSPKKQKAYALAEKILAPFTDKIICISETEKQSALNRKICRKDKLHVIYNGVDIDAYEKSRPGIVTREGLQIPNDAYVIGMVGRMSEQKAPDVFIRVAYMIKESVPNIFFIMVGGGELEEAARNYAEEKGFLDSVYFTGWIDNPMDYVDLFDIAVLLSRWEGFGLVIPEYMIARKPVVATRVDAIPEIVKDGETGILVNVDDVEGTCEAILKLIRDEVLRTRLAEAGRKDAVQRFDVRRTREEYQKLFENLLSQKG